ncbi:MAG: acetyl-CoA decarbonylase/synthase complex subunit gamma [Methanomicrobiales archaeon]|nr:acetyl-CoA decarbonylase/synthase complex subunit gamma [Methanomicrobiales archaeon]
MKDKPGRRSIKEISPIDVYRLLPGTACKECGEPNCMAFATRLVNGEVMLDACPPLRIPKYQSLYQQLQQLLAPAVRAVTFGFGDRAITIGGKHVLQRHELTYHHPPPIAIEVSDQMAESEIEERIRKTLAFSYLYIGRDLRLDAIAVRAVSGNPTAFASAVRHVATLTDQPIILCTLDPQVMAAGLEEIKNRRPLLYAATQDNWKEMGAIALAHQVPLVVHSPGDIALLRSLTRTLQEWGIRDLVMDPGTYAEGGLADTLHTFTLIRRAACHDQDEYLGYPMVGIPMAVWATGEFSPEMESWKEAVVSSLLITRYADLLVMHSMDGWVLLPQLIWRFNLYTDPRKPVSVEAGLREFGTPTPDSPVLLTTNYALTYFTVESDIKSAHLDCYLVVVDTSGISVESAVAGRYLTPETIATAMNESGVREKVGHHTLILPGLAARLSGEVEEVTGWRVLVGSKDSSGIPSFIKEHWPPDEATD